MTDTAPADAATMTVTVRDRDAEPPWGSGRHTVATRQVTISAHCPRCGGKRGQPHGANRSEDGVYYWVQEWANPCGHRDAYTAVIDEAAKHYPDQFSTAEYH